MGRAAIYSRYSTHEQRETSLDDQIRRCRKLALERGYDVPDELVFSDAAVTGTAKGIAKRTGYQQLLKAWDERQFEALIVDEISRLARDMGELVAVAQRAKKTNVHLLAVNGLDSSAPHWELIYNVTASIAQHFVSETRQRVYRGTEGQLERGFMIAPPAYGFKAVREVSATGTRIGTRWHIDEPSAKVIREIYSMRCAGKSFGAIAAELNGRGIPSPRKPRTKQCIVSDASLNGTSPLGMWRASSVKRMLANPVYRGTFVLRGSAAALAKAKQNGGALERMELARPALRLVDDETWFICNANRISRTGRGGGRHVFAGLIACGQCGGTLWASVNKRCAAMYCPQCQHRHREGALESGPPYVSMAGVTALLVHVLEQVLTEDIAVEFRKRLEAKLKGDRQPELDTLRVKFKKAEDACKRIARLMREIAVDEPALEREYRRARLEREDTADQLRSLEQNMERIDATELQAQLRVDPRRLVPQLFGAALPPEHVRAVLSRIFPRIVLLGKRSRFVSLYKLSLVPGVAFAEATGTRTVQAEPKLLRFSVATGPERPVRWTVTRLPTGQ